MKTATAGLLAVLALVSGGLAAEPTITVYKNEGCGGCELWIKHIEKTGFTVNAQNVSDTADGATAIFQSYR